VTRTEERLTDALDAVGRAVRDDELRELPSLAPGSGSSLHLSWRRWLAPASAAAAVLLIAGVALSPVFRHGTGSVPGKRVEAINPLVAKAGPRCSSSASSSGGPTAEQTSAATEVASGSVAGQSWSVWVKKGLSEPAALEQGGLVLSGRWYGMCQLSNYLGAELVDAGSRGIAYGYLAMPGKLRVSMAPGHALGAAQVVRLAGVSAFVAPLAKSACAYPSITLDASTATGSATGSLKFGTCKPGHAVAITRTEDLTSSRSQSVESVLGCNPSATLQDSGSPVGGLTSADLKVASGSVGGQPWSLWSRKGVRGIDGVKSGGLVVSGRWYGLCSTYGGNGPASLELINAGGSGVVYGLVVSPADHDLQLAGRADHGVRQPLPTPAFSSVQGGTFLIGLLPKSACEYRTVTVYPAGKIRYVSYQVVLGSSCAAGHLVSISGSGSDGAWALGR
jgi:hypothetical protein